MDGGDDISLQKLKKAIKIDIPANSKSELRTRVHLLPCHAKNSRPAPVSAYFETTIKKAKIGGGGCGATAGSGKIDEKTEENAVKETESGGENGENEEKKEKEEDVMQAAFRGRQLTGPAVKLPEGFEGLIFCENKTKETEDHVVWKTVGTFQEFMLWNRDSNKHERDDVRRAIEEWPVLAQVIHSPV